MIRALILYYLNIKPTHGYEIQRFIQLSGIDKWAKIQSGSIYYALTKLEKEKNISVLREERTGARLRKIYEITSKGKNTLSEEMKEALAEPLFSVGSPKFIISPIMDSLSLEDMEKIIQKHIKELKETEEFWSTWGEIKAGKEGNVLTNLSFQITIDSIKNQIRWHEELRQNLPVYKKEGKEMSTMISLFDADSMQESQEITDNEERLNFLNSVKAVIINNPESAVENIDRIIEQLKKEK
jgi:DNA-binding PadR family transcriptional regulator